MIIDSDSHLYETRTLWADHAPAADRGLTLRIADDERGYPWLTLGERRIEVLGLHRPGENAQSGRLREALREGRPANYSYDDMAADFWQPQARVHVLDGFGIGEAIALPNCGIMWEKALESDLAATLVNMSAWNRWCESVVVDGGGRLHPVAHVTLRDLDWLDRELASLAAAGVRLAMVAPALVDGRRLSHPAHERAWASFARHGIAVVFHIAQYRMPFDEAWVEGDPDWSNPVLSSVFMWTAPALALADLSTRGVLARHPDLRIGVVELMSAWLPQFLLMLDGGFRFHADFNGAPLTAMELLPSEYVKRQVRVAAFPFEHPERLAVSTGDLYMFGSDYPHPEGLADPIPDFRARTGRGPDDDPVFYGGNAAWLLGRSA